MDNSKSEAVPILLRVIRLTITLSETEYSGDFHNQYSCSWQEIMKFSSYKAYTRLASKTNCQAKLYASLTSKRTLKNAKWTEFFIT